MAMHYLNLTPSQQSAGQQIYSGFYGYAISQGASPAVATNFANTGLGVASGEGLGKANPWSSNPDAGVTSLGPFQLNLNGGVGSDFGLNANSPPSEQINAAASTMWNGGTINTGPWNAVGDTIGGGNNTALGQSTAADIGSRIAAGNGLSVVGGNVGGDVGNMSLGPADPTTGIGSQNDSLAHTTLGDSSGQPLGPGNYPALNPQTPMTSNDQQFNLPDPNKVQVTDIASSGVIGQQQIAQQTLASGKAIQAGEQQVAQTQQQDTATAVSGLGDLFARGSLVAVGLLLLLGALIFYYMQSKDSLLDIKVA